ncbi:MAG: topoisomerase DNA-binding C4 zinc finger domain-containing protein [Anaerolineales bacterium]|nr:topoisomerase DNA-binding C4 zinc finger domain-containing protein [Anaerolineales bacterium]
MVRVPAQLTYNTKQLEEILNLPSLQIQFPVRSDSTETVEDSSIPTCPKCGSEMILRTTSKGPNEGKQFWGCPNYPRCRGILNYRDN